MTRTALFVSPHLDDAVFSAGGTIARLVGTGWAVTVATVFTASVAEPEGFALACQTDKGIPPEIDYMAVRRAEDAAACTVLGARTRWLDLAEAPHRGYGSARALFGPVHAQDTAEQAVRARLEPVLAGQAPDAVFGPDGMAGHVDHLIVRAALERLRPGGVLLWRDEPYGWRRRTPAAPGALPVGIDRWLVAKTEAAGCYGSQLDFQFGGPTAMVHALCEAAEIVARGAPAARDRFVERFTGAPSACAAFGAALSERIPGEVS
ncbi:MAG: PIG-L deacetylase family protein [Paracoccaceae bacterium]